VGAVELGEQADDFLLRRQVLALEHLADAGPDLADGAASVHQAEDEMRRWRQAMECAGLVILQQIPDAATEALAMDFRLCPQPRPDIADAVPGGAVETRRHQPDQRQNVSRTQSRNERVQIHTMCRGSMSILATPCIPGRRAIVTLSSWPSTRKVL